MEATTESKRVTVRSLYVMRATGLPIDPVSAADVFGGKFCRNLARWRNRDNTDEERAALVERMRIPYKFGSYVFRWGPNDWFEHTGQPACFWEFIDALYDAECAGNALTE